MASNHLTTVVESDFFSADEAEDLANRKRLLLIIAFVWLFAAVSVAVYLWLRPHNRHLEPTPYDNIISQLRSDMTELEVLALLKSASETTQPGELATYDETDASGTFRIVAYRMEGDEPLKVRLTSFSGLHVAGWCYRDHCHDNIY